MVCSYWCNLSWFWLQEPSKTLASSKPKLSTKSQYHQYSQSQQPSQVKRSASAKHPLDPMGVSSYRQGLVWDNPLLFELPVCGQVFFLRLCVQSHTMGYL
ncbi:hypothetical protein Pelo_8510 [Pelomyxa schiedti]|nr:hypothetical protein Pelo_8510 [Pelomyxa schiedti]